MKYDTTIRTSTVTQRHNTMHINSFDWDYDFEANWKKYPNDPERMEFMQEKIKWLKQIEAGEVDYGSNYGGWPRIWQKIVGFGMASAWPYWKPRPAVLLHISTLGTEWVDWSSLKGVKKGEK